MSLRGLILKVLVRGVGSLDCSVVVCLELEWSLHGLRSPVIEAESQASCCVKASCVKLGALVRASDCMEFEMGVTFRHFRVLSTWLLLSSLRRCILH